MALPERRIFNRNLSRASRKHCYLSNFCLNNTCIKNLRRITTGKFIGTTGVKHEYYFSAFIDQNTDPVLKMVHIDHTKTQEVIVAIIGSLAV